MRRSLLLAMLVLPLGAASLRAQIIRGSVVDDSTKLPIASVAITLIEASGVEIPPGVRSDTVGAFTLHAPRPGTYRLKAVRIGYRQLTSDPVSLDVGQLVTLRLRMTTVAQQLVPVRIVERRRLSVSELMSTPGFDLRASKGLGTFMTADQLESHGLETVYDLLDLRLRSVLYITQGPNGPYITIRQGILGCSPEIYLDGVLISSGGPEDTLTGRREAALAMIGSYPANSLHGIEVYRGGQLPPPSLGGFIGSEMQVLGRRCGAVAVWTKNGARPLASSHTTSTTGVQVISGVVVDLETERPVAGVPVRLLSRERNPLEKPVVSDSLGRFVIRTDRAGFVRLETGSVGFQPSTSAPFSVAAEELLIVRLFVSGKRPVMAPLGIAVRALPEQFGITDPSGFAYRRERGLVGSFISSDDIARRGPTTLAGLLSGIEGVIVTGAPPSETIALRSAASRVAATCVPAYFINGKQVITAVDSTIRALSLSRVLGIEVYRGPAEVPPVFFDAAGDCGMIGIWTEGE